MDEGWLGRWGLEPDGASARTATGSIRFVRRGGERLVLKLIATDDEADQPRALESWRGEGAVRLVASDGRAMLMERAWPGRPLADLVAEGRDDEATGIVCDVMARLHRASPADLSGFRTIEDWGRGFARVRDRALAAGVEPSLLDRGAGLYRDLCASQAPRVLLHGDLQHYNVLFDQDRGWLAIDPKAVVGESAYETGAALRNPAEQGVLIEDPRTTGRRVAIMAEWTGLDRRRILAWRFAQLVLAALWRVEDGLDAVPLLRMARATPPPSGAV